MAERPGDDITFFHIPNTRSSVALALIYELDLPVRLKVLNRSKGENHAAAFRAINPLGKVPALTDRGVVVTEQVAIFIHLADRFSLGTLAPALDDPDRGAYLRWLLFYAATFEPAVVDRAVKHETPPSMATYGDFDTMFGALTARLQAGPYILGERFSAADILWGAALAWTTGFGIVPAPPVVADYVARIGARPCFARVAADDARWAAEHEASTAAD
jgi:glutathione S-transferase